MQNIVDQYEQAQTTLERAIQFGLDRTKPELVKQMLHLFDQLKTKLETEQKAVEDQMKAQLGLAQVEQECLAVLGAAPTPSTTSTSRWNDRNDPTGYNRDVERGVKIVRPDVLRQMFARCPQLKEQFKSGRISTYKGSRTFWEQQNIPEDRWKAMRHTFAISLGYDNVSEMVTAQVLHDRGAMQRVVHELGQMNGGHTSGLSKIVRKILRLEPGDSEVQVSAILSAANDMRQSMGLERVQLIQKSAGNNSIVVD